MLLFGECQLCDVVSVPPYSTVLGQVLLVTENKLPLARLSNRPTLNEGIFRSMERWVFIYPYVLLFLVSVGVKDRELASSVLT